MDHLFFSKATVRYLSPLDYCTVQQMVLVRFVSFETIMTLCFACRAYAIYALCPHHTY
jgi:hypothetical protein